MAPAWISTVAVALLASLSNAAPSEVSTPMVGMKAYEDWALPMLRSGEITKQFSSYDRKDGNDDGFEGTYSCLKEEDGRCIIADVSGSAGQISSIWFTYDPDSVAKIGDLKIVLDGKTVVQHNLQSIVDGDFDWPWPFTGNTNSTNGGNVIKIPMPYDESMQVSTENNPHFYHVTYNEYPKGTKVETFDPNGGKDVIENFKHFGVRDLKSADAAIGCNACKSSKSSKGDFKVNQGSSASAVSLSGGGVITSLKLRVNEILAGSHVEDDGRAFGKGGSSSFKLSLDKNNKKCKLTRRLDKSVGNQVADVKVDGKSAGQWTSSGTAVPQTWGDQVLELDPELTKGKTSIAVENTFASSDLDFNEFHYALHCQADEWANPSYGVADGKWVLMDVLNVGGNNYKDEEAHEYKITGQTWSNLRWYHYDGDRNTAAQNSTDILDGLNLRLTFDGHKTVEAPIGSFFLTSLEKFNVRSAMVSVDDMSEDGAFTCWWPMPFKDTAKIELVSKFGNPASGSVAVGYKTDCDTSCSLSGSKAKQGYFSTGYKRANTTTGELWNFLTETGRGVVYGVSHAFRGAILPPANGKEFLEGDEKIWVNTQGKPGKFEDADMLGTGTEDYYESGWYFKDFQYSNDVPGEGIPFSMPMTGLTGHIESELNVVGQGLHAYRLQIADSMNYDDGISFNIEHGPVNSNINADYETCAFYYKPL